MFLVASNGVCVASRVVSSAVSRAVPNASVRLPHQEVFLSTSGPFGSSLVSFGYGIRHRKSVLLQRPVRRFINDFSYFSCSFGAILPPCRCTRALWIGL